MEPAIAIAALSLACNVLQLVDSSLRAVATCKQLYEKGSTDKHDELISQASEIENANQSVRDYLSRTTSTHSDREKQLMLLAKGASENAEQLSPLLSRLGPAVAPGKGRLLQTFQTLVKTSWKSSEVKQLEVKLREQDEVLRSSILEEI
jgi:Na+/phosphate symporter